MKYSIIFLGNERDYSSVYYLTQLLKTNSNVIAVISFEGKSLLKTTILKILNVNKQSLKKTAKINNIQYIKTSNINSPEYIKIIKEKNPDLICVGTFFQILNEDIFKIPRYGTINVHPSLLPKYRGANPYFWIFKNAEKETGVTIHYIDNGVDTGDIISQKSCSIPEEINIVDLKKNVSKIGSNLMIEAISKIFNNDSKRIPQQTGFTFQKPNKSDYIINHNMNVKYINNFVKGIKSTRFLPLDEPIFKINNKEFIIKDVVKYNFDDHNKFPEYGVHKRELIFYAIDGTIIFKIESFKEKCIRKCVSLSHYF